MQVLKQNLKKISKPIFDQTRDWKTKLTAKEMQICSMIKQGLVIKEIAPIMHLSPRTVEKYRENIRKKLGLKMKKLSLSAYLIEQGI
ncbi:MAG: helix-turn-helix transcriptional regulator [Oligoflexales bacterium]